jgi:hypothetical protein
MSAPSAPNVPGAPGGSGAPKPRIIIPSTSRRDLLIAVAAGLLVLTFIGYGVMRMAAPETGNKLTGIVVGRQFTPFKERQVSFNGRKIEGVEEIDGEYDLKVRVDAMHKTYDVPVEKSLYEAKKDGDTLTFIRPPSEQR